MSFAGLLRDENEIEGEAKLPSQRSSQERRLLRPRLDEAAVRAAWLF